MGDTHPQQSAAQRRQRIAQIVSLIDLTDLDDDHRANGIEELIERAAMHGTAAVCVWPEFVATCAERLAGTGVSVATVVNFPSGDATPEVLDRAVADSLAAGANDIDVVLPYRAMMRGDLATVRAVLETVAARVGSVDGAHLKVILETGVLSESSLIRAAATIAIECGADFIKTSTGKTEAGATVDAVEVMLEVIVAHGGTVGIKPSGGIRTVADAETYLQLVEQHLGAMWVSPEHMRFGASGLLGDALSAAATLAS